MKNEKLETIVTFLITILSLIAIGGIISLICYGILESLGVTSVLAYLFIGIIPGIVVGVAFTIYWVHEVLEWR